MFRLVLQRNRQTYNQRFLKLHKILLWDTPKIHRKAFERDNIFSKLVELEPLNLKIADLEIKAQPRT